MLPIRPELTTPLTHPTLHLEKIDDHTVDMHLTISSRAYFAGGIEEATETSRKVRVASSCRVLHTPRGQGAGRGSLFWTATATVHLYATLVRQLTTEELDSPMY